MAVWTRITTETIDPSHVTARVASDGCGAVILFLGNVRNNHEGRKVVGITYDAQVGLGEKILAEIGREIQASLGEQGGIAIEHRVGDLKTGETSLAIAVGSPHRDEAYEASRRAIEEIKRRVPVWKKEIYENGESEWLPGHSLRHP